MRKLSYQDKIMKKHRPRGKTQKKPGSSPGTLLFTGEKRMEESLSVLVRYSEDACQALRPGYREVPDILPGQVNWMDVRGLHDTELIAAYGRRFNIHPLVLEDVVNPRQRPKFEEYGEEVFIVLAALQFDEQTHTLETEQITIYFGRDFLISFQEKEDDTFAAVRERLEKGVGRIRSRRPDYLAYAMMDNVVDNYFTVLDRMEEWMEELEAEINTSPARGTKEKIHHLKFQLLALRKAVMPLREAVGKFSRCENGVVSEATGIFVRDLYDHVIRIADMTETYRDMMNGLQELYLAELSIRMNNIIQVLTIITTVFVPLTFLAGLYGMNFENMPELKWKYGYFMLLGFMFLIFLASLLYFKKKKWIRLG